MSGKTKLGLVFVSLSLFFFAAILLLIAKDQYSHISRSIPPGSSIGEFPLTGNDIETSITQINAIFESPLELVYAEQRIQADPVALGFTLDNESMRKALNEQLDAIYSSANFITFLFGREFRTSIHTDILFQIDEQKIRTYLENEISPRYDLQALPKQPAVHGAGFYPGHTGRQLDVEAAVPLIKDALGSAEQRSVVLPVSETAEPPAMLSNLQIMLKSIIDQYQDAGQITEVYFYDTRSTESFDIARMNKADVTPEVSFTAASTMKLPIMIASYARMDEEPTALTKEMLRLMITESKNDQTDWMMENVIGGNLAPFTVTEDMNKLGLPNTFLAGYFYLGAPLLDLIKTPANTRTDINLKPDVYNQTTARDMGVLMSGLYQCDKDGTGLLLDIYGSQITQHECNEMIELLTNNRLPYLISGGVPDTVTVAHKHGWIEENDGLLHTMSNVGAVYSPGGDYILSIYTYHPENLIFDAGNKLFTQISATVYGFFNPALSNTTDEK